MNSKEYPCKEQKKKRANSLDKRPHITQRRSWWRSNEIALNENDFYVPNIKSQLGWHWNKKHKMKVWTLQEIHTLIDMWAEISWDRNSWLHKDMSAKAEYFRNLWIKQRGKCAITGVALEGVPGLGVHGIGVDIINYEFGIEKGNIRLVSAPIAYTRYLYRRCDYIENIHPDDYCDWPIYWPITKDFHSFILKNNPFFDWPVFILFLPPRLAEQRRNFPPPWIRFLIKLPQLGSKHKPHMIQNFEWRYLNSQYLTIKDWEEAPTRPLVFADVYIRDGMICCNVSKKFGVGVGSSHKTTYDYAIELCDPTIDFNKKIIEWVQKGFSAVADFYKSL